MASKRKQNRMCRPPKKNRPPDWTPGPIDIDGSMGLVAAAVLVSRFSSKRDATKKK